MSLSIDGLVMCCVLAMSTVSLCAISCNALSRDLQYTNSAHVNQKAHGSPALVPRVRFGGGAGGIYQTALLFHSSHTVALSLSGLPDMLIGV